MSKAQPTLFDFKADAEGDEQPEQDTEAQSQREAAGWRVEPPRCQCGADLLEWHSKAEARRMVRQFGDADGEAIACPSCTSYSHPSGEMTGVARAVRISDRQSTVEPLSASEEAAARYREGGR
ncbi:hypothetical protein [Halorubrum tropicale]|uniref:Uncharacterized protein n=1 Tax=Halorubrum tropicale TaxID=1765655 RepID=A0A0M9ALJ7_9EURY|nr:hypothetical protein [Halorubrum tropicale]KOX93275.1 hypothetical protein AMR74_16680 [Halorubrum tropicale]